MDKIVICIGRQFGSGGRVIGRKLAERLGIPFYDKQLLLEAARDAGLNPEVFERSDERFPRFMGGLMPLNTMNSMGWYSNSGALGDDSIYRSMSDFIRSLAERQSCVIVGRTADFILRDHPGRVSVFIHSNMEDTVKRIMERGEAKSEQEARQLAQRTNKLRANYYTFYTDTRWGDAATYDLTLNSSVLGSERAVDLIEAYIKIRFTD